MNLYSKYKVELGLYYDHIAKDIRIRMKADCYEQGEKSTKFFLDLEEQRGIQNNLQKFKYIFETLLTF